MRISAISSSIASVVARVIASVATVDAVRTFLHLTAMRGHTGCWHKRSKLAYEGGGYLLLNPNMQPGKPGQDCRQRQSRIALAVSQTPFCLAEGVFRQHG